MSLYLEVLLQLAFPELTSGLDFCFLSENSSRRSEQLTARLERVERRNIPEGPAEFMEEERLCSESMNEESLTLGVPRKRRGIFIAGALKSSVVKEESPDE